MIQVTYKNGTIELIKKAVWNSFYYYKRKEIKSYKFLWIGG